MNGKLQPNKYYPIIVFSFLLILSNGLLIRMKYLDCNPRQLLIHELSSKTTV